MSSPPPSSLFRQEALQNLDRQFSPDQLDRTIVVTSPRSWLILLALIAIVAAGILWAVFGSIPRSISGQGILTRPGGTFNIPTLTTGVIRTLSVRPGDPIQQGDVIAEIQPLGSDERSLVPVTSFHSGRVLAVSYFEGNLVQVGDPIANLELLSQELDAYLYIPAGPGKLIRPGMPAQIQPASIPREEYGFVVGEVRAVSDFPVTAQALNNLFNNAPLVQQLLASGPVLQVEVDLQEDPGAPGQYVWSSSRGPAIRLTSGTTASGEVVLSEGRPIGLVVPSFGN